MNLQLNIDVVDRSAAADSAPQPVALKDGHPLLRRRRAIYDGCRQRLETRKAKATGSNAYVFSEQRGEFGSAIGERSLDECPELMTEFLAEIRRGQDLARAALRATPDDHAALFFLGKMDLNYVWLQLGLLGRKTG